MSIRVQEILNEVAEVASRLRIILDESNTELYPMSEEARTELGYLLEHAERIS